MAETVEILIKGDETDFIAAARKVDAENKRLSETLKKAGVSQAAYNKVVAQSNKALQEQAAASKNVSSAIKTNSTKFTEMSSAMGLARQGLQVLKAGFDFAEAGAQLDFTKSRFDLLSESIGTTGDALLGDLQTATRGMYSDMELMASATDFVGLGLANTADEAVRLAAVSGGLNMNMNQLVLTLTNMTTMRFDALGVRVDGFKEKVKALEDAGYSADAAFKEAFLQQAEAQLQLVGSAADSSIGSFMRMKSAWADMVNALKTSPSLDWVADFNRGVEFTANAITNATNEARENKTEMQLNKAAWAEHRKELGYSGKALLPIGEEFEKFAAAESNARDHAQALRDELDKITNGTAPPLIASLDGMAGSLEEVSARNADLINDAISIQASQDKYNESQQETLDKIAALQEEKANMHAWEREDIAKIDEKIKDLQDAYSDASNEFVKAQQTKLTMMALEKIALSDGVAGYSEAEAEKAMAILETADIAEASAIREAIAFDTASTAIANSKNAAEDLKRILEAMSHGYTIDVATHITTTGVASTGGQNVQQTQYAAGGSFIAPNAAGGSFIIPHANGQSFMLPASVGNEAFRMAGGHTATGGERVTVTPQNKDIIDYKKFARVLRDTLAQAG